MSESRKKGSLLTQIISAVVIALLVGGTAPWWWQEFFENNTSSDVSDSKTGQIENKQVNEPDLTGEWQVIMHIDKTTYTPYKGLVLSYRIFLTQSGNEITGSGEKDKENDRSLEPHERSPIKIAGTLNDGKVIATFDEWGAKRKTSGQFVWNMTASSDFLQGTFTHTAANASGRSEARRVKD